MLLFLDLLLPLLVSGLVLFALFPLAPMLGLIDHPTQKRKHHRAPVPTIGGIAVFCGIASFAVLRFPLDAALMYGLLGGLILVVVGAVDDRLELGHRTRFAAQIAAALVLVLGAGVELETMGNLFGFGDLGLGTFSVPVTVFAMVGMINAFNMIDGIDGLSSGLALVALIALLALLPEGGQMNLLLLATIFAVLPFMLANLQLWPVTGRKVFLGDAGSMLLGYIVVWSLVEATQAPSDSAITPVTALWLTAVPLMDTFSVMGRRVLQGRSPFAADRGHLHHVLSRIFGSTRSALILMLLAGLVLAGVGLLGHSLDVAEPIMFYGALLMFAGYVSLQRRVPRLYYVIGRRRRQLVMDAA